MKTTTAQMADTTTMECKDCGVETDCIQGQCQECALLSPCCGAGTYGDYQVCEDCGEHC